jgi:serine/threonine protein kinase
MVGDSPIAFGGFADVWRGVWRSSDPEEDEVSVAVKVLRQQMMQDIKDKFVKVSVTIGSDRSLELDMALTVISLFQRLKEEVLTWHRLSHPSIATLFGIVQLP